MLTSVSDDSVTDVLRPQTHGLEFIYEQTLDDRELAG